MVVLIFLLASKTQASGETKSCVEVVTAFFQTPRYSTEFSIDFIKCLNGIPLQINSLKPILSSISQAIKKPALTSLPSAEELLYMSAYLLYESVKLYDQAMNLDIDYKLYKDDFEALQRELNIVKDFIEKEVIPQSKRDNIADLQKIIEKLLGVLSRYSEVLRKIIHAIHRDTKKAASDQRWSAAYATGATALCTGAIIVGHAAVFAAGTCVASVGTVVLNVKSYFSLGNTLEKLDFLLKDSKEMREDIDKYRSYLNKMSDKFYM